jgi:hypothetical protein
MYSQLRELRINVDSCCSPDLANLFCLPRLRLLRISKVIHSPSQAVATSAWPEFRAASNLQELELFDVGVPAHMIVHMLEFCRALSVFKCQQLPGYDLDGATTEESRGWCVDILRAVEKHAASLTFLRFDPNDKHLAEYEDDAYAPVDSFRKLEALEMLDVPFKLLAGKPCQSDIVNGTQLWYPDIRKVLPTELERLWLSMCWRTATGESIETLREMLLVDVRDKQTNNNKLNTPGVHINFDLTVWNVQFPLKLWDIEQLFKQYGVGFEYRIWNANNIDDGREEELDTVARDLWEHGLKGVEMAQHFINAEKELAEAMQRLDLIREEKLDRMFPVI